MPTLKSPQMPFSRARKAEPVVGLAIEAGKIGAAVAEVNGSVQLTASAVGALTPGAFHEGEVVDREALASSLKRLFGENKLPKQVRLGVGNQRVVVRTMRLPAIEDPKEMAAAVRFQAQEQMPMPLDQAVLEHQVAGVVPAEESTSPQVGVVVVAARRDMIESFLEPLRNAGLEPVGIDLSAFAMIRALGSPRDRSSDAAPGGQPDVAPAVLFCHLGDVINLAVARAGACLFARVSPVGLEGVASALANRCGLTFQHAEQWLAHVGLEQPLDEIEGAPEIVAETRRALEVGVTAIVDELRRSLDYYGAQEGSPTVERIILGGPGSAIPGVAAQMEEGLGAELTSFLPPALSALGGSQAAHLTLPFGLALEA